MANKYDTILRRTRVDAWRHRS